jgi:hypothetical protein
MAQTSKPIDVASSRQQHTGNHEKPGPERCGSDRHGGTRHCAENVEPTSGARSQEKEKIAKLSSAALRSPLDNKFVRQEKLQTLVVTFILKGFTSPSQVVCNEHVTDLQTPFVLPALRQGDCPDQLRLARS